MFLCWDTEIELSIVIYKPFSTDSAIAVSFPLNRVDKIVPDIFGGFASAQDMRVLGAIVAACQALYTD